MGKQYHEYANNLRASDSVKGLGLDVGGDVVRVTETAVEDSLLEVREVVLAAQLGQVEHLQTVVSHVGDNVGNVTNDLGVTPRGGAGAAKVKDSFYISVLG